MQGRSQSQIVLLVGPDVNEGVQVQCGVDWVVWYTALHCTAMLHIVDIRIQQARNRQMIDQGWNHENFSNSLGMEISHSYGSVTVEGSSAYKYY